ncbi:MAG: hypothetical protein NTW86_05280 [Candidatus Sumerlaeota bacterium]|nr:hypothetical protein [Candidatus Sumerlaeota bacterium]
MPPTICLIGAGSRVFGLSTLSALLRTPELRGSEIRLVDVRADELGVIARVGERINREWNAGCVIRHSTDRAPMLPGADFIVLSVAVDRWARWKLDREIGARHGITHYAENGGPASFAHTARNLQLVMPIFNDIAEAAPDAYVLNFTNPVPRVTLAARRYADLEAFGICHQINYGYRIVGYLLRRRLGVDAPDEFADPHAPEVQKAINACRAKAAENLDIKAAGLNHFTWMLSVADKETGEDLYPLLLQELAQAPAAFEPLSRRCFEIFGLLPVPGDTHLSEYLPYTHNPSRNAWERYHMRAYDLERATAKTEEGWKQLRAMADGTERIDPLKNAHSERVEAVIAAIVANRNAYEQAINLPNEGAVANLPEGAIVEVPAVVSSGGIHGLAMGRLPDGVAELCRREAVIASMTVDAIVYGDRLMAIEAMALQPMVDDLDLAVRLVDDYIDANKGCFPDFE